jgi:hypothetical protein
MTFAGMNWLAILIATIAGFAFGAAYYMSLSKPWLAAIGKTKEQIAAEGKGSPLPFIISIVALAVMAVVLAGTIGHLGTGQMTLRNGVITALFMWVGFVITTMAVNNAFGQRKPSLTVIDGIHWLGVLVIQGAIVGAMGK